MIHRSSSSRRRKTTRTNTTSPQRSNTSSLVRKQGVAFENQPSDDIEAGTERDESRDRKFVDIEASAGSRSRGGSSTNLSDYAKGAGARSSSITVTATDEYNSTMFPVYSSEKPNDNIGTAISLNEYPPKGRTTLPYDGARSSRNSVTPDDVYSYRGLQNTDFMGRKSKTSCLAPEMSKSPRSSLVPEDAYNRGSRGSIDPSLFNRGSRNSLLPDTEFYNRTQRPSMVADVTALRNSRSSLLPDLSPNRSPRNSLVPDMGRGNFGPDGTRSSRSSLVPESNRSPRNSLVPESNRTPRGSFAAEASNRTPRGSVTSEGSMYSYNRSSRSSLPLQDNSTSGKSPRGSIASATGVQFDLSTKTPRGSIESVPPGMSRVSGQNRRSTSPFHSGSLRGATSSITNKESTNDTTNGSRRASSSVSQVSTDDRRHLCEHTKLNPEAGLRLTAYGSFVYQLNHANMESSNTLDFVLRALTIIYRTVVVTILLGCLLMLPLIMFIMGMEFLRDCPKEPHLPLYMIVGGCFGLMKLSWLLYGQIKSLRYERLNPRDTARAESDDMLASSIGFKIGSFALNTFLAVWFLVGNYWIWHIYWPDHEPTLYKPDNWCHKTLYVFAVVHLIIVYSILSIVALTVIAMAGVQICLLRCR